jgi:hypothetical protein
MSMVMSMGVTRVALANRRSLHNAQNARRIRLQHLNTNHPDASAKTSQAFPGPALLRTTSGRTAQVISHTRTAGWPPDALSTGK